jgi:hypothetical protein
MYTVAFDGKKAGLEDRKQEAKSIQNKKQHEMALSHNAIMKKIANAESMKPMDHPLRIIDLKFPAAAEPSPFRGDPFTDQFPAPHSALPPI